MNAHSAVWKRVIHGVGCLVLLLGAFAIPLGRPKLAVAAPWGIRPRRAAGAIIWLLRWPAWSATGAIRFRAA